ncbi:hypothetical protein QJS10_CPA01g01119 [Acorus calamus]|uniref:Uncharacterized protein n=1 Tax=Acorus calamus TaxID=4465 RepID=A0AAV9FHY7_ACOCL|nr:hypothetical protein QJS10_CPA01g01119 [Acorus calamus]
MRDILFNHPYKIKMRSVEKACIAVTLAAALGLRGQVIKSNFPSVKRNWSVIGSSSTHVRFFSTTLDAPMRDGPIARDKAVKLKAAEESLRMVVYLSCWGPN